MLASLNMNDINKKLENVSLKNSDSGDSESSSSDESSSEGFFFNMLKTYIFIMNLQMKYPVFQLQCGILISAIQKNVQVVNWLV